MFDEFENGINFSLSVNKIGHHTVLLDFGRNLDRAWIF
jgi:hypothetical protein